MLKDQLRDTMMDALAPMAVMAVKQIVTVERVQRGADEIRDQLIDLVRQAEASPPVEELLFHVIDTFAEALKVQDFDTPTPVVTKR